MIELPRIEGGFGCVLVDPPWHYKSRTSLQSSNWKSRRDVEKHYPTMSLDEIALLPVKQIVARDSHLFMWITGPMLVQGAHLPIMKAWGFKPSSMWVVWAKLRKRFDADQLRFLGTIDRDFHIGPGMTSRQNAEYIVLGRRGNAHRNAKDVRQLILSPRREHSRKPDEQYGLIERYCDGPRVELFARTERPGWTAWGNDTQKFAAAAE